MTISAQLHFCWIGPRLPWAYVFAIISAVERGEIPDITLHHTDELEEGEPIRALRLSQGVKLRAIDPQQYLVRTGQALDLGSQLARLYASLENTVMRADLLRAAILYTEGGLYLDLDTLTVASLLPLLDAVVFLGSEFIVWPRYVRQSRSPLVWARHLTLDLLRRLCRRAPHGWTVFRRIQALYVRNVNNAVMGAEANSAFFSDYLRRMANVPVAELANSYALGPTLLQNLADQHVNRSLHVHNPGVFSPLPPEISEHWFRITRRPTLSNALLPETRIVHWYASIRTKLLVGQVTPAYVLANRHNQLYSALVYACIGGSPAFTYRLEGSLAVR